jgi:hypothetical protein
MNTIKRRIHLLVAVLTSVVAAGAGASSALAATMVKTAGTGALNLLSSEVFAYATSLGPYQNGIWQTSNTVCWACNQGGPATAAATVYMLTGRSRPATLRAAEGTIDRAIATRQRPDGSFLGPPGDTQSPDVATMFFGVEEGNTFLELSPVLDPARRARWKASLAAAAGYLIHNGNLNWYTNGNVNLGNAELFYLAWRATGDPRLEAAYNQALTFALHPPQSTWPGRGLVVDKQPTRADGSDGAAYLTETGDGGTGFDPEYTSLQVDVATRLYMLSGDPAMERLANMLVNMLLTRVNRSTMMLNTSSGTRHTEPARWVPLITSSFAVLGLRAGRTDLLSYVLPQLHEIEATYAQSWNDYGEVYRRALGNDVSVMALATNLSRPLGWAIERQPWRHRARRHTRHRRHGYAHHARPKRR